MLDSGLLNTNKHLGINASPKNQLLFRRTASCSPIHSNSYAKISGAKDSSGYAVYEYDFGSFQPYNWTYLYNSHASADGITYHIEAIASVDGPGSGWDPIPPLKVLNADVGLFLLASNAVSYLTPVKDPWFSATTLDNLSDPGSIKKVYKADSYISALACVDQYQICNPNSAPMSCTILGSMKDMYETFPHITSNNYQNATALRILSSLSISSLSSIVQYMGQSWLYAQDRVSFLIVSDLPSNQWQIEVQGWFETSLAQVQALEFSYPNQPTQLAEGDIVHPNATLSGLDKAAEVLCSNQRARNIDAYQSFSALGLIIIIVLGLLIIILSLTVADCVTAFRRRRKVQEGKADYREIAFVADYTLQLQRMALMATNHQSKWEGLMSNVPYTTDPTAKFSGPTRVVSDTSEDFRYI
ncbi:hypothetical protein NA57DRAFT_61791 [Rhizodiscina lignyota]|uniref:Uncharacterized protein n=1 Tax=Rhizodiscina lignyota TaxID=1504668 RepID=A0A9P4M4Y0_9PEZI|nr:hypothetical protein NA57DRAFT_61791 [Rhizodiscina lignyota]